MNRLIASRVLIYTGLYVLQHGIAEVARTDFARYELSNVGL